MEYSHDTFKLECQECVAHVRWRQLQKKRRSITPTLM